MRTKFWHIIAGVAVAIILGALGSGIWERLLSPAYDYCSSAVVGLFGSVSISFKNSIYREAARGFHERHALSLLTYILSGVGGLYTGFLVVHLSRRSTKIGKAISSLLRSSKASFILLLFVLAILFATLITSMRENFVNQVTTYALNGIEILGSDITAEEQAKLRAEFFQIKDAEDFYSFHNRLQALAEVTGVPLDHFDPL